MVNDIYVKRDSDGEIVFVGSLQECVKEARQLVASGRGSYTVASLNSFGSEVVFNRYPDADIRWEIYQELGLVPRD